MSVRLFVALEPPSEVVREAERASRHLRDALPQMDARFPPLDQAHLTVAFLGAVDEAAEAGVAGAIARTARLSRPFDLLTAGLGAFPSPARATVLWLGFGGGDGAAARLASDLAESLRSVGHAPDDHRFVPHLTLARIRRLRRDERPTLSRALSSFEPGRVAWRVDAAVLLASHLGRDGARYEPRARFALEAPPRPG